MSRDGFATVMALEYYEVAGHPAPGCSLDLEPEPQADSPAAAETAATPAISEEQVLERLRLARMEEGLAVEQRLRREWASKEARAQMTLMETLRQFGEERSAYFAKVEPELVHLVLAIAKKILQREAQMDPTLLAALVRIALDNMQSGPAVRLHVPIERVAWWNEQGRIGSARYQVDVMGDASLTMEDCLVETELGTANFGFEAQLKEVEQGFLDLLAQMPGKR